jgi:hypothetical protein
MNLNIHIPKGHENERQYILSVFLKDYLGLDFQIKSGQETKTIIFLPNEKKIKLDDQFFSQPESNWLNSSTLPTQPFKVWNTRENLIEFNLIDPVLPVIYGNTLFNDSFFFVEKDGISLGLDIFGSAFFMMSRYEEAINKDNLDSHNRFRFKCSFAYKEKFLHRPIVNEYLEILWACIKYLCPNLKRKSRVFRFLPSHDVDDPKDPTTGNFFKAGKHILFGDILKRRDFALAKSRISNYFIIKNTGFINDHYNKFNYIMSLSEKNNLVSTFNFIAGHTAGTIDGFYSMAEPYIRNLLYEINERGHEIGIHPSYNSYEDASIIAKELQTLKQACIDEGILQEYWGGRTHFLRFDVPNTFKNLEQAGLHYDNTLTYPGLAGFRCGICYEYPAFDVKERKALNLKIRPLIAMECSLIDKQYMGLGTGESSFEYLNSLKLACKQFSGDFSLLWHNSRLIKTDEQKLYESLINY